jgi:hypothetical protein
MGVGDRSENLATDWSGYPGLAGWVEQLDLRGRDKHEASSCAEVR